MASERLRWIIPQLALHQQNGIPRLQINMEALSGDMGFAFDGAFRMAAGAAPVPTTATLPASMPAATMPPANMAATGAIGEWKEWDDAAFDSLNFELDLGFDTFLLATADDFMEPFAQPVPTPAAAPAPASPEMFADLMDYSSSCMSESESSVADEDTPVSPMAVSTPTVKTTSTQAPKRSRKRKNPEVALQMMMAAQAVVVTKAAEKKVKVQQQRGKTHPPISAEAERLYRRRYDILHEILEAWNTGGIEDMEEIADDVYDPEVTLVSPDYSEGLKGVQALMHHWTLLLDSFPDGIMEEYNIERDDPEGQKMNVSWVFSGTQIFPFFGVEPRHEKVTIRGKSFFTFKGEKISQMVLSWNYREALMKLMGVSA